MDSGIYITLGIGVAYAYAYGALLQCAQITMGKRRAVISGAGGYTETQIVAMFAVITAIGSALGILALKFI